MTEECVRVSANLCRIELKDNNVVFTFEGDKVKLTVPLDSVSSQVKSLITGHSTWANLQGFKPAILSLSCEHL